MTAGLESIEVGDIVEEVNYIAYFNTPMKARVGIVLKVYQHKTNPSMTYSHQIAKVYWLNTKKFEAIPVYLLKHYQESDIVYECEKI